MEFSTTQRGRRVLIYYGFEYLHYRKSNQITTWRCRQSRTFKCHSNLKTENDVIIQDPTPHCHDSCPQKIEANIGKRKMVEAMKGIGASPQNVIGTYISKMSTDSHIFLPKKSSLKRVLLNHKSQKHPTNPTTINFEIPERYSDLVLYDTGVNDTERILALGDKEILSEINKILPEIFGDGTFDKVPRIYFQLYTWHTRVGNSYIPCIYFLLCNKTEATYVRMFDIIKTLVPNLAPKKILLDFERAAICAARSAFINSEVKGCYFHLMQSVVRKVNTVGLKTTFEINADIKLKLKSLPALAFVPANDVKAVFQELACTFPMEDSYKNVLSYFFSTYIEDVTGGEPLFPISLWNQYEAAINQTPRTTNCCEGFHNALNSIFNSSRPTMWFLFDGLRRDVSCHKLTVANAISGKEELPNKKYTRLFQAVSNAVKKYDSSDDKLKYLRHLANLQ